jgi:hypothetical protein
MLLLVRMGTVETGQSFLRMNVGRQQEKNTWIMIGIIGMMPVVQETPSKRCSQGVSANLLSRFVITYPCIVFPHQCYDGYSAPPLVHAAA